MINQDRNAVIEAYAINKDSNNKKNSKSQFSQNNSKHLSHSGISSHEEYSGYMNSHSLTNKSNTLSKN